MNIIQIIEEALDDWFLELEIDFYPDCEIIATKIFNKIKQYLTLD